MKKRALITIGLLIAIAPFPANALDTVDPASSDTSPPYRADAPVSDIAKARGAVLELAGLNLRIEFETHRAKGRAKGFFVAEEELQARLATDRRKSAAAIDLTLFYLAHGLAEEALAVLDEAGDRDIAMFLKGVALFEMARFDEAIDVFQLEPLRYQPTAIALRAVAHNRIGAHQAAIADFEKTTIRAAAPVLSSADYYLSNASSALATNDFERAQTALHDLHGAPVDDHQRAMRALVEARMQLHDGKLTTARNQLARLRDQGAQPFSNLATLDLLRIEYERGEISVSVAIGALRELLVTWRGGQFERETLSELARASEAAGDLPRAIELRRAILNDHERSDMAAAARAQITASLAHLVQSDAMAPLDAAEIFYENIDLAPPGREGDALIKELASNLIRLDLLKPATELLEHQVFKRLRGEARSVAAADLADAHLARGRPTEALRVIRSTRFARLPDEVATQRRLIEAAALWRMDKTDNALALLQEREETRAVLLRADIHWAREDWAVAANDYLKAATQMSDEQGDESPAFDVMLRAAAGFILAGDEAGLSSVQSAMAVKLTDPSQRALLDALSASDGEDLAALLPHYKAVFGLTQPAG